MLVIRGVHLKIGLEDTHSLSCWGHLHLFSCKLPCFLLEDIYDINCMATVQSMQPSEKEFLRKATFLHRSFPTTISFCRYIVKKRERFEVVLIVGVIDEVEGIIDHAFSPKTLWMLQISKLLSKIWYNFMTSRQNINGHKHLQYDTPTPRSPSGSVVGPGSFVGWPKASGWKGQRCKNGPRGQSEF